MDDFFLKDIAGLFTFQHLIYVICAILAVVVLVLVYLKRFVGKENKIIKITFFVLVALEIAKICYVCFYQKLSQKLDDWVPLYFCSLTMYALGLSSFGKGKIKLLGDSFLFFGGIVSGMAFLLYPTTALLIRPLIHPLTIHSLIYHCLSVFVGLMIGLKGYFKPQHKHIVSYLIFTLAFSLIAYIVNITCNQNFMLINNPWQMAPLKLIYDIVGGFYPIVISVGQSLLTFYISFGVYKLIIYLINKKEGIV